MISSSGKFLENLKGFPQAEKKHNKKGCRAKKARQPCTFVRMERKQYENICYFTDHACGFEFAIGSHATKMKTGYVEGIYNRWEFSYYDYIATTITSGIKPTRKPERLRRKRDSPSKKKTSRLSVHTLNLTPTARWSRLPKE